MLLEINTLDELRDKYTQDVYRGKKRAGVARPNVAPGSEAYIRGEAIASAVLAIQSREVAVQDAHFPDTGTGDELKRSAKAWRGIDPMPGAGAQGYVVADCVGTVTYVAGLQCLSKDSLRYQVQTNTIATDGTWIPVVGVDVGKKTDQKAGVELTWQSPPAGSNSVCEVASGGLTNGADPDNDAMIKKRFQDALRHPADAGSWAHYRKWAVESSSAIQDAFIYPAIEGPSTTHVAICVEGTEENYYSREANAILINIAAKAIVANCPDQTDVTVTTVEDVDIDVILRVSIPDSKIDGGKGGGWVDSSAVLWPTYGVAVPHATYVTVTPTVPTILRVFTFSAPVNDSHIAIWSNSKKKFIKAIVQSSSLVSGTTYDLTLYTGIDITAVASGDYVSPDAENIDAYGQTLAQEFALLGPGEKTSSADLLPRSYRKPLRQEEWPSAFTSASVGQISIKSPEFTHATVVYPAVFPRYPTVTSAVTDPPEMLRIGKFAIYPY